MPCEARRPVCTVLQMPLMISRDGFVCAMCSSFMRGRGTRWCLSGLQCSEMAGDSRSRRECRTTPTGSAKPRGDSMIEGDGAWKWRRG